MMEPLILSLALPKSLTLLSLPSWRSPSQRVRKFKSLHLFLHSCSVGHKIINSNVVKIPADFTLLQLLSSVDQPPGPYWVLSSDYDGHSLVYGCTDFGLFHMELSWILARQPTLPEETIEKLHGILSSIGASVDKMVPTIQEQNYCSAMNQWIETLLFQPAVLWEGWLEWKIQHTAVCRLWSSWFWSWNSVQSHYNKLAKENVFCGGY